MNGRVRLAAGECHGATPNVLAGVANETGALRGGSPIAGVRTAMAFVAPPVDRGRAALRLRVLAWLTTPRYERVPDDGDDTSTGSRCCGRSSPAFTVSDWAKLNIRNGCSHAVPKNARKFIGTMYAFS